jgi:hypothetical protein
MRSEQEQYDTEYLEDLFVTFAERFFALLESWTKANGIQQQIYFHFQFTDDSWEQDLRTRRDYGAFLQNLNQSLSTMPECVQCVEEHWNRGLIPSPEMTDKAGQPITIIAFEQDQWVLVRELLSPVLDILNQYGPYRPSYEQILASYHRWRELWQTPGTIGQWEVSIPLFNFSCELQQAQAISSHLQIAPFTPEEKTSIWNSSTFPQPFMGIPINFEAFRQTTFKLTGTRSHLQGGRDVGQEIPAELDDIITALRLLKVGDAGALAFFEKGRMIGGLLFMLANSWQTLRRTSENYTTQVSSLINSLNSVRTSCERF